MTKTRTITTALLALAISASASPAGTVLPSAAAATGTEVAAPAGRTPGEWDRPAARTVAVPAPPARRAAVRRPVAAKSSARTAAKPAAVTHRVPYGSNPYFRTPEEAMRYLASAYNRRDNGDLRRVTTPESRAYLATMRPAIANLRLASCAQRTNGQYDCLFHHVDPQTGQRGLMAHFVASPAMRRGWYMTMPLDDC